MRAALCLLALAACYAETNQAPLDAPAAATGVPDVRCTEAPSLPGRALRHTKNELIVDMGEPRHRGVDLIAADTDDTQKIAGVLAYSGVDKALEDEDAELFACTGKGWRSLGTARTDDEGEFSLTLTGSNLLPVGLRDLYAASPDGSGVWFLALVAPAGSRMIISDVDGTLTSSENAYPKQVFGGSLAGVQPGAPAVFAAAAADGVMPVFLTARGGLFTESTREWLAEKGFPRAPVHLADSIVTMPGASTVTFKQDVVAALVERFDVVGAIGNRASDIEAYTGAGVAADRIFIKLPEYKSEVAAALAKGEAIGFSSYSDLPAF